MGPGVVLTQIDIFNNRYSISFYLELRELVWILALHKLLSSLHELLSALNKLLAVVYKLLPILEYLIIPCDV